jgi:hypothetical protein
VVASAQALVALPQKPHLAQQILHVSAAFGLPLLLAAPGQFSQSLAFSILLPKFVSHFLQSSLDFSFLIPQFLLGLECLLNKLFLLPKILL